MDDVGDLPLRRILKKPLTADDGSDRARDVTL